MLGEVSGIGLAAHVLHEAGVRSSIRARPNFDLVNSLKFQSSIISEYRNYGEKLILRVIKRMVDESSSCVIFLL